VIRIKVLSCVFVCFLTLFLFGVVLADTADFSGNWQGTWTSYGGDGGGASASITQSGTNLSGTLTITNTECGNFNNLSLSGTVSDNVASFFTYAYCPIDGSNNELQYTDGVLYQNNLSGFYVVYSNGSFYDAGTFSLNRSTNIITASAGPGGTISPSGTVSVPAGTNRTFIITSDTGYKILDVKVDGMSVGAVTNHTFTNVQSNHTIAATFIVLAPVANFTANPTSGDTPLTVKFTDQSTGDITTRSWSFGDGAKSIVQNPSHTYARPGTYTVSLTVVGPGGSDTETKSGYIVVKGTALPWIPLLLEE
jgi:PKD repeat protein